MDLEINGVLIVALITGFVELCTRIGLNKRYAPIIAVGLGIISGIFYIDAANIQNSILIGITLGLSSVGLYSGTKNTLLNKTLNDKKILDSHMK
ncbi:hypothetical protein [Chengkuizengella axinellae]|uniref:Holin n=1 Tax=Chengkuizengella axinellae TaxID=3064388 RepID=A0ABT9IW20_9BACL|nr:hypothetical protein [Chengkuizengella sp. 2205SS18-9]MDP5273564.1 hypothetical protein [Chengkuizengella sp. 2205SS18-9]